MKVYINGEFYERDDAKVSVFDHGLLYGDGVFEGIRLYDRRIFKLKEHVDRLYESAHSIALTVPMDREAMSEAIIETVANNELRSGYIRVVVTRGSGPLGLNPFKCHDPQVIIFVDTIQLYDEQRYRDGMSLVTIATRRNMPEAVNPRLKSLNYLNNILAKIEAVTAGYDEALMLNDQGYVAECTGENIFIVKRGGVQTPSREMGILEGVTRNTVLELARRQGRPVAEVALTRHDVYNADECFLTGTAAEVVPVVKVDSRTVGAGRPGEVTLSIIQAFRSLVTAEGVLVPAAVPTNPKRKG